MKKFMLFASIAMVALLFACGGGGEETSSAPAATAAPAFDPATAGVLTGTITLDGEAPEMKVIQMAADPNCARLHTSEVMNEFVITGDGGTLANVFVYIKSGLEGDFPPPSEPVVLDQTGCNYVPHVMGIQVGQTLTVRNSDETLHNIHAMPKKNKEFNIGQPIKGLETEKVFDDVEVMVPFKCDVHKWMNSYAGVLDHPYFAVTAADGSFSISDVPPGDYVVAVWHERLGTQEMNVTVGEKETVDANFSMTASD
jgi:plastocyanin